MSDTRVHAMDSAWQRFDRGARDGAEKFGAFAALAEALNLTRDSVQLAVEIASFETTISAAERDALVVLVIVTLASLEDGNTRFPVTGTVGQPALLQILRPLSETSLGADAPSRFAAAIASLLDTNRASETIAREETEYKPLLYVKPFIGMHKMRVAEREVAARLAAMLATVPAPSFATDECARIADDVCATPIGTQSGAVLLSAEQRAAVAGAMRSRLTLISGGPGTGKTSIVIAILRLMVALGINAREIALAAPTGKAANRIGECIARALTRAGDATDTALREARLEPATLHRLLGYSPESHRFRHHRNNPLAARVVIVDEGSMLDLSLMEHLVSAIGDGARVIILGDADQLPSIAAGTVFRELIPGATPSGASALDRCCFRLGQSYRMTSANAGSATILAVATRINAGDSGIITDDPSDATRAARRSSSAQLEMKGVELLPAGPRETNEFLARWYDERVRGDDRIRELRNRTYVDGADGFSADDVAALRELFAFTGASRILTVTRVFDTGADRINQRMHSRASGTLFAGSERLTPGEPVITIRNNYELALFNGDNGIVLRVRREDGASALMAVFARRDNFVAHRIDMMRDALELAYAMTVHKAQGSEFDAVALILPDMKIPLLTREVLYTAVSRARRSVAIAGSEEVLAYAIATAAARYSGLRELLTDA